MRTVSIALVVAGCSFQPGAFTTTDAPGTGADSDGPGDDALPCAAWNARHFDACAIPMATLPIELTSSDSPYTFDTTMDGGELTGDSGDPIAITSIDYTQAGDVHAALWTMTSLVVESDVELYVIGDKPLIIAAWDGINIAGTIDAGSYRNGRIGAGSHPAACAAHAAMAGADGNSGNGGGGGGGFHGNGGAGGNGDSNCSPNPPSCQKAGGMRGTAVDAPTIVRGGCDGGASGAADGTRASGGRGGGAVLLASRYTIQIANGSVLAGGAGGSGDSSDEDSTGGGGGGSGGFIGLDAPMVQVSGTLAANGGGGGAGADVSNTGDPGGNAIAGTTAALGGSSDGGGTGGGNGSSLTVDGAAPTGTVQAGGGGGGGGGGGFILYWSAAYDPTTSTISPAAAAGP